MTVAVLHNFPFESMKLHSLLLLSSLAVFGASARAETETPALQGWKLVWADEFDRDGTPDPVRWNYDIGGHGWGNRELQFYTDRTENARVEHGLLVIEARREAYQGKDYTSARLVTKDKGDWTYGRFEIRAKLPSGRGTWPAIWMLPTKRDIGNGEWPDIGEIDIMEHVGYNHGSIHASTHSHAHQWRNNNQRTGIVKSSDVSAAFHTYTLEWDADEIRVYFDDQHYFTSRKDGGDWKSWPFYRPFHLLLNVAVGGDWGGEKGVDPSIFPQRMEVDYVRVYQREPAPIAP